MNEKRAKNDLKLVWDKNLKEKINTIKIK